MAITVGRLALDVLRPGGTAYAIGLQKPGAQLALDGAPDLFPLQKSLKGVFMGSTNPKRDIPVYADLYLQGRLNLDDLIHNHISLDGINEATVSHDRKKILTRSGAMWTVSNTTGSPPRGNNGRLTLNGFVSAA